MPRESAKELSEELSEAIAAAEIEKGEREVRRGS
jgi:hypothetical protein